MEAIITLAVLGIIFGIVLGLADKYLQVEIDERVAKVNEMLPQFNCGACGEPGCMGLAEKIVDQTARVSLCRPLKKDKAEELLAYLEECVGPNGEKIDIKKVK